jgi:hypothetical protein
MSSDSAGNGSPPNDVTRPRRSSVTSAAFANLFPRSNSTSAGTGVFPGPVTSAAMNDQRRRLSISTVGLSGSAPLAGATPFGMRRTSMSTNNSDSIDESAIDDDEPSSTANARTAPTTPFARRMSFGAQAMRSARPSQGGTSPIPNANNGRPSPPIGGTTSPPPPVRTKSNSSGSSPPLINARSIFPSTAQASNTTQSRNPSDLKSSAARTDQGFNWSEQLRSRAESSVAAGSRPSFSFASGLAGSPPRGAANVSSASGAAASHDRAKSISDLPAPPAQAPQPKPAPQKPDHFQERILKGDFYMD